MKKQITTEEIARRAGVSRGSVDRVLHNRGKVSPESRAAIEAVLDEVGYQFNLHTSAVSLKKTYRIVVTIPQAVKGEYWGLIKDGIESAADEYYDFKLDIRFCLIDQFDAESCQAAYAELLALNPDGVVIGPVFVDYTLKLCQDLDRLGIPYVFVDTFLQGAKPLTSFVTDQTSCGKVIGRLLAASIPAGSSLAVMDIDRKGIKSKDNFSRRYEGLLSFARQRLSAGGQIYHGVFSSDSKLGEKQVMDFLRQHPDVKGIGVLNSRGYLVADILSRNNISDVVVISMDLTSDNIRCLRSNSIRALVCQRPQLQSFFSIEAIIRYLLFKNNTTPQINYLPIDIVLPETLDYSLKTDIDWHQINTRFSTR